MNEKEIIRKIIKVARDILDATGFVKVVDKSSQIEERNLFDPKLKPDFTLEVKVGKKSEYFLVFEIKSIGQPRYVRMTANQLQSLIGESRNCYGVFGASYLSEESRQICREQGIGYIDLTGNCLFNFDSCYINIEGKPKNSTIQRPLKSIFSTKATRALRVLLCNSKKEWYVRDLASEANISIGLASNLKKKLFEYEFIEGIGEKRKKKFILSEPFRLLNKWVDNYNYRSNEIQNYYSLDEVNVIENKLVSYFKESRVPYAFTLTSGASRVAPFLRYKRIFAYVREPIGEIVQELKLKKVPSGANITFLEPYDEGVFYALQEINGVNVVSDIQLYLDLMSFKERGEEAAEFLLENRLKKRW